jgi:hypothetical protein
MLPSPLSDYDSDHSGKVLSMTPPSELHGALSGSAAEGVPAEEDSGAEVTDSEQPKDRRKEFERSGRKASLQRCVQAGIGSGCDNSVDFAMLLSFVDSWRRRCRQWSGDCTMR